MNLNGEWDWEWEREEEGWECGWQGGYGGKNHYVPKVVFMKCMKFVFLK